MGWRFEVSENPNPENRIVMPNPRLASRYAKALLDLAIEQDQLEQEFADMQWLQAATSQSRDLLNLLRSPITKSDLKTKAISAVLKGNVSELTQRFVSLLISKNRESALPEIAKAFVEQYKQYKDIHTATLTTAVPVSDAIKNNIIEKVKQESGYNNIELVEKVDPNIIGGFVLEMGDMQVDASIAYDLREVAKQFKNNDFIYKVR